MVLRMYVNNVACFRVKVVECECFRMDKGVKWVYHVTLVLNIYMGGGVWV